ncbi:MAG: MucR family transcriptional regulator [Phenylobacterium sp.]|jgi:predicted transcriptional regulator|uniref:MucR family transcriptional regulator n=1 Tax=Phenylobacterium sp. TaxID=1871053 RepID=UPI00217A4187|nr:MucR family transcriptional regulator [Phenylobacterium sp.]MCA3260078.1 MucR family transcriptional regulator [Rubrivivax sp.]MCA3757869.1 MucR family transcriptional regulator [Phenylobacterium sp.]
MTQDLDSDLHLKLAADIAVAYIARNAVDRADIGPLIVEIRQALARGLPRGGGSQSQAVESMGVVNREVERAATALQLAPTSRPTPPVPVEQSITDNFIICFEDGRPYRSLRRHLMAKYGMTPDDYRRKWDLPTDYPMVAPSYARDRSEVAKRIGLGKVSKSQSGSRGERSRPRR